MHCNTIRYCGFLENQTFHYGVVMDQESTEIFIWTATQGQCYLILFYFWNMVLELLTFIWLDISLLPQSTAHPYCWLIVLYFFANTLWIVFIASIVNLYFVHKPFACKFEVIWVWEHFWPKNSSVNFWSH